MFAKSYLDPARFTENIPTLDINVFLMKIVWNRFLLVALSVTVIKVKSRISGFLCIITHLLHT